MYYDAAQFLSFEIILVWRLKFFIMLDLCVFAVFLQLEHDRPPGLALFPVPSLRPSF